MEHSVYCNIVPCTCGASSSFIGVDPFPDWVDEPLDFRPRQPPKEVKRCVICNKPTGSAQQVCRDVRCALKYAQAKMKEQLDADESVGRIQPRDTDIITTGIEVSNGRNQRDQRRKR